MTKKSAPFFATRGDLIFITQEVMASRAIDFVRGGMFPEMTPVILGGPSDLGAFETYLVLDHGVAAIPRAVPQRAGGQLYAFDQLANPNTVVLHIGGEYKDRHLVAGQIGTVGETQCSDELYALFLRVMRSNFEKIKSFYVGREAGMLLDSGARLSATPKSASAYDLVR